MTLSTPKAPYNSSAPPAYLDTAALRRDTRQPQKHTPRIHRGHREQGGLPNFTCLSHQPLGGCQRGTQPVAVGLLPGHASPRRVAAQAPGGELNPSARVPAHPSPPPAPHFGQWLGPELSVPSLRWGGGDMQMSGERRARLRSSPCKKYIFSVDRGIW